ncbi:MAG: dienelactone hydrolase family protein [Pseudomonadota bacterium]
MRALRGPEVAPADGRSPQFLVILLHGVGADGADLIDLAPMLQRYVPHAAFVAPNGPERCDMAPMGYQWFSLRDRRPEALLAGVQAVRADLDAFIDAELQARSLPASACAIVGFSQGTMTALHVVPRRTDSVAALVGFSGALVGPERLAGEVRSKPPILLIHGEADEIVPAGSLFAARDALESAEFAVQWQIRPRLGHGIDPDGIDHAGRFLRAALTT